MNEAYRNYLVHADNEQRGTQRKDNSIGNAHT